VSRRGEQRGFMLIVAIFMIVVAAALASVIAFRVVGGNQASSDNITHAQALYLAHTGVERWIRQRALNNAFTGEAGTAFGNGTFTTTSSTATDCDGVALAANRARVNSVGSVTQTAASASLCVIVDLLRVGGAMMVYAREDSLGVPYYRRWNSNTGAWGAETAANDVGPEIFFMVLKFARTRNEALLGVQDTNGDIWVQRWTGTAWTAPVAICDAGTGSDDFRGFDIEYESQNDRAVIVCNDSAADQADYLIWDGTSTTTGTVALASIGEPLWIEMAPNPLGSSNEIALIALGDSSADVKGMRWTGTAWSNMGLAGDWDNDAATDATKVIDVAYEQLSGRAMFIWGDDEDDNNGLQNYRIWDGANLSGENVLDLSDVPATVDDMDGRAAWLRLVPRPGSNELLYGVQDDNEDLFTALWDGTAWGSETTHDTTTESQADRNFDIVFETYPTNADDAWVVWGDSADVSRRQWSGAAWGGIGSPAGEEDTALTHLAAHPSSGTVWSLIYEGGAATDPGQIFEMHLTGGSGVWSGLTSIWGGDTEDATVHERVFIAPERYTPIVSWREVLP
jgi:hypothetical protein